MSEPLEQLTHRLNAAQALEEAQVWQAVERLASENVPAGPKADFLAALSRKGETPEEIAAFARALRDKSIPPPIEQAWRDSREILDVVGTGGDRLNTFNISTTASLVCAAAGAAVAKHGNRAVTSQAGSADVLEALGVPIDLTPEAAVRSLRDRNFAFFFAPKYHPAFKNIAAARKLCAGRGQRTIFNLLGPLLNPAQPSALLVGVPRPDLCRPLAHVLQSLGVRRAMVVCGEGPAATDVHRRQTDSRELAAPAPVRLDELSTLGLNHVAEFYQALGFSTSLLSPEHFSLQPATLEDLRGGDKRRNAEIVRRILRGDERGPKRDAVLLNAGAALFVAGKAKSLAEGWNLAAEMIDGGQTAAKLAELAAR